MSTHASASVGGSVEMKELSAGRNKKVVVWKTYNPAEDEEDERAALVASAASEQGQKEKETHSKAAVAVNPEEDEISKKKKLAEEEEEEERKRKAAGAAGAGGAADGKNDKNSAGADLALDKRCCCILTPLVLAILFLVLGGIILAIIFGVIAPLYIPVVVPVGASPSTILVPNIPAADSLGKAFALQVEGFSASDKPVTVYTANALPSLSAEKKKLYFADSLVVDKTKQHQKYGPIYLATGAVVGITYKYQSTAGPLVLYILNTIQAAQYAVNPNVLIAGTCSCFAYTKSFDLYPNSLNSTIYYTAILPDNYIFVTVFKDQATQDGFQSAELAFSTEVPVVNVDSGMAKVCTLDQQTSSCELPKSPWLYAVAQQELTGGVVTPTPLMLKYGFQPDSGKYVGLILGLLFGLLALSCVLSIILIAVRMILARVVPFLTTKFVCLKCCICCCMCLGRKEKATEFMKKLGGGAVGGLAVGAGLKTEGLGAGLAVDANLESGLGAGIGAGVGKIGGVGADISGGLGAGLQGGLDIGAGLGIKAGLGLEAAVSARTRRTGLLMKKRMGLLVESELEYEERMKKNARRRRRAFLYAYRLRYDPSGKQYDSEEEKEEEKRKRRKQKESEKEKKKSKEEEEEERVREEEEEKRRKRRRFYRYYRTRRTDEDIVIYGRWQGGVQGGPKNSTTYYNNEQYVVQAGEKGGKVHIVVRQKKQEDEENKSNENKKEKQSRKKRDEPQDQNREFFYAVYRVPDESTFEEDSKKPLNSIIASSKSTVEEFEKKYLIHTSQTKEEVVESDVVLESNKRYIIVVSQMSLMDGQYELTLSSTEISFTFVISESSAVSEESQVIIDGDKTNSYAYKREMDLVASNHQEQGKKSVQEVVQSNKSSLYVVYNNYHEKDIHCYLDYYSEEKKEEENKSEGSSKQSSNDNGDVTVYVLRGYEHDQKHYKSSDEKQKEIPSRDIVAVLSKGSSHEFVLQPSDSPYFIVAIRETEEQKEGQQTYHFTLYSDAEIQTDQQSKREEHVMDKIKSQVLDYAVEQFDKLKKLEEEQKQQQETKKQQKTQQSQSSLVSQGAQEKKEEKSEEEQKKEEQQRKEDEQRIFNRYRETLHELKEYFATKDENNERGTVTQQEFVQIVKEYHISLGYYKLDESEIQLLAEMYSENKKDEESSNNKQSQTQKGTQSSQQGQNMTNYERFINDLEKKDSKESSDPSESPLHPYLQYLEKVAREEEQKNEKSSQSEHQGTVKVYHYNDCVYALVQGSLDKLEDILPGEAKEHKIPLKIMLMTDKPFPSSFVEDKSENQESSQLQGKEKREEMQKKQQQQVERITEAANQFDNHLSKLETFMNLSSCNTAVFCEPSGGLSQQFVTDVLQNHEFMTKQAVWVKVEDEHSDEEEKSSKSGKNGEQQGQQSGKGSSTSTSGSSSSQPSQKKQNQEAFETFVVGHCSKRDDGSSGKEESGSQSSSSSSEKKSSSTSQNDNKSFEEVIDWKHKETVLAYPSSNSSDKKYVDSGNEDQKPLGLVRHLIYNFSNIGDLVLDVASGGSATTLIASYLEKRSCIVVEQNEEAFRRLVENFERVKGSSEDVTERKKMYSFESADCICDCKCP